MSNFFYIRGFQLKKYPIPAGRLRERRALSRVRRGVRPCAPINLEIIWDNLFFASPLAQYPIDQR